MTCKNRLSCQILLRDYNGSDGPLKLSQLLIPAQTLGRLPSIDAKNRDFAFPGRNSGPTAVY